MNQVNSRNDIGHDDSAINIVVVTMNIYYYYSGDQLVSPARGTLCREIPIQRLRFVLTIFGAI